jgi:hypothetical protein
VIKVICITHNLFIFKQLPFCTLTLAPVVLPLLEAPWKCTFGMAVGQAKPKCYWGTETSAKRKPTSSCLLAIPAFDRVAGLYNRHLNSNRAIR